MDFRDFIGEARSHYLDQYRDFVARQTAAYQGGAAALRVSAPARAGLVRGVFRTDFVAGGQPVEMQPDPLPAFPPVNGDLAGMAFVMDGFRWDHLVIAYEGGALTTEALDDWFETWFEAEEEDEAELPGVIHAVIAEPGRLTVDFGAAPDGAFWTLLRLLEQAGVRSVRLGV